MGVYLSEPNKQKTIEEGKGPGLKFVAAGMQGISPNNFPRFQKTI